MELLLNAMGTVGVGGVLRYGVELLAYHFVIYLIGGMLAGVGLLFLSTGVESFGSLDPGVLLGAGVFFLFSWVVIIAGQLGIIYKVIADAVVTGMEGPQGGTASRRSSGTSSRSKS